MIESVLVLGMHRSGTSCLAGFLKSQGVNFGEVSNYNKYNLKGNQEDKEVFKFNEAVLNYNDGSWKSPPLMGLKLNQTLKDQLDYLISKYNTSKTPWAIKDPRMLLAYEIWQQKLPYHSLLGTFRHPLAVAKSLFSREAFPVPINKGLELWEIYNSKLLKLYEKNKFHIINFDLPKDSYIAELNNIATFLNLTFKDNSLFFESGLRNQKTYSFDQCPDNLKPIYRKLLEIS